MNVFKVNTLLVFLLFSISCDDPDENLEDGMSTPGSTSSTGEMVTSSSSFCPIMYPDLDQDGEGDASSAGMRVCSSDSLWSENQLDCNDRDSAQNSFTDETCDQKDNDCDGVVDEGLLYNTFYVDYDGDGFGSDEIEVCRVEDHHVARPGDCDDSNADINPSALEVCGDGVDNDCSADGNDCLLPELLDSQSLILAFQGDVHQEGAGRSLTGLVRSGCFISQTKHGTLRSYYESVICLLNGRVEVSSIPGDLAHGSFGVDDVSFHSLRDETVFAFHVRWLVHDISLHEDIFNESIPQSWDNYFGIMRSEERIENLSTGFITHQFGESKVVSYQEYGHTCLPSSYPGCSDRRLYIYNDFSGERNNLDFDYSFQIANADYSNLQNGPKGRISTYIGDQNSDGLLDLAVGSPAYKESQNADVLGGVYLIAIPDEIAGGDRTIDDTWGFIEGDTPGANFGSRLLYKDDITGDGRIDLLVSSPNHRNRGKLYIFSNLTSGRMSAQDADATIEGRPFQGRFATSFDIIDDINHDGIKDLVVGAPLVSNGRFVEQGSVFIFYGPIEGHMTTDDADVVITGSQDVEWFGYSVLGLGDIDGNGASEIAIGAPQYDNEFSNAGAVYILYGPDGI